MGPGLDSDPEWGSAETAWWDPGAAARVRDREEMARARGLEAVSRSLLCVLKGIAPADNCSLLPVFTRPQGCPSHLADRNGPQCWLPWETRTLGNEDTERGVDMRIAVAAPTGHVGRHLVPMLIRAGVKPLVLLRDPDRLAPDIRSEVDVAKVDLLDSDAVVRAVSGVDALYWVDPPPAGDNPLAEYKLAAASVARAVSEGGVGRVVFQSSVGAEKRHGVGEIDGLAATEVALNATDASVIHLRCGYFFTNLEYQLDAIRAGVIQVLLPVNQSMPWVSPRDIAEVATGRLLSGEWRGHHVQAVHGPADLSWLQVVGIISEAVGKPLDVERIAEEAMRGTLAGFGMSAEQVDSLVGMSTGFLDGFTPEQQRSVHSTTPTTLAEWAYAELRPLLQ